MPKLTAKELPWYRKGFTQGRMDAGKGGENDNPELPRDPQAAAAYLRGYRDALSLN